MGDAINVLLDDLLVFLTRLLDFPLCFLIFISLLANLGVWLLAFFLFGWLKKPLAPSQQKLFFLSSAVLSLAVIVASSIDHKNHELEMEGSNREREILINAKKSRVTSDISPAAYSFLMKEADTSSKKSAAKQVQPNQKKVEILLQQEDIEILKITFPGQPAVAYMATLNLDEFDVILDTAISIKESTGSFAKRFDVDLAINGEAGRTPGMTAPLGQWIGNYVVKGKVILNEDTERRPFVYFNQSNQAFYSPEKEIIKLPVTEVYQAIWGRFDLLREGQLAISSSDGTQNVQYPRTVIGMDKTGKRAYVMVVDGRRPLHSMGMTMKQCGELLLEANCYHAMSCDQGGSSAMFVKGPGIISKPCDGSDRPVYSHLGFRRKAS